jgi:hypothetical protein
LNKFSLILFHNNNYYVIKSKPWEYFADPFIYYSSTNEVILFVELYSRINRKGKLVVIKLIFHNHKITKAKKFTLIDEKFHLSFPSFYLTDNYLYILPESTGINSLLLYKLDKTNFNIIGKKVIAVGHYADPLLYNFNNKYFLSWYTGFSNNDGYTMQLEIPQDFLLVDDPNINLSNAINISVYRSAGQIFNKINRPIQDNNGKYGFGMLIENITNNTTSSFIFNSNVSHHYSINNNTWCIDFCHKILQLNTNDSIRNIIGKFYDFQIFKI